MTGQATGTGELDTQEILHLALKAMADQRDADAMALLKRGVALDPQDGRLQYLLGAMHAQVGMYERAIEELQRAVVLAPDLDMAHFQLGMLLITRGDIVGARDTWAVLDRLEAGHPLNLFRDGMTKLVEDDFDGCVQSLRRGIEANHEHEALNRDMQRVIEAAEAARDGRPPAAGTVPDAGADTDPAQHVLLAGYRPPSSTER